ncbi:MAG TPA: amino acid transporter [Acetobacteraceae bacterium]|nr:amino acid transporter [Acetobacteraceae bacterium]
MSVDKGLKKDAISFLSNVTFGISSTSPAYSVAASLGPIAAVVGYGSAGIMLIAFVPMLFVAVAFYHLNRADPDCGTTFSWARRAIGPRSGWLGGWSVIVANILVMPSLADIAGRYSFQLVGIGDPSAVAVGALGIVWILVITAICYMGIALSARTQHILLGAELVILLVFAVLALIQVYGANPPAEAHAVARTWFDPFHQGDFNKFAEAMVLAVFLYWGWDSCLSVNEESKDPHTAPGYAAVVSTIVLVGIYVLVVVAAVAVGGPDLLAANKDDALAPIGQGVLGIQFSKILIFAVLSSALASTQTSILPAARMALSMAHAGAIPVRFRHIHTRHLSPGFATLTMGAVSTVWYLGLTWLSQDILTDSIAALGLVISFYYGLTGLACVALYRSELFESIGGFISKGLIPAAGSLMMFLLLFKVAFAPGEASQTTILGVGGPVAIAALAMATGVALMLAAQHRMPRFFRAS